MKKQKYSYYKLVDYAVADPAKILAQKEGKATAINLPHGYKEITESRGESAYVFDMGTMYGAFLQEGLGTKSLITQKMHEATSKSYFAHVAQDTVATIINDLITVGARPVVLNAYWSSSSYKWLGDKKVATDFINGWKNACDLSGVAWGGGETQSLPGIISEGALEFAGSAFGVIDPKSRLTLGDKLKEGDAIILFESSGIHANGLSLARKIAQELSDGYLTKLPNGAIYGEELLKPSTIYAKLVQDLFAHNVEIHYMSNITGHGWRKLMRHKKDFTYRVHALPPVPPVLEFMQKHTKMSDEEAYGTFNMGAGFAVFIPQKHVEQVLKAAKKNNIKAYDAGVVEKGPKQVVIEPLNVIYASESLEVRA